MPENNSIYLSAEEYIDQRLNDQINWYSKKSAFNQSRFKRLRLVEIVAAALIPFLSGMGTQIPFGQWVVGTLGVAIALSMAINTFLKHQENWIQYRTTCEQLKREQFLFATRSAPYNDENAFQTLVMRAETLMSQEVSTWTQVMHDNSTTKKPA
ncbi:MAG: DUF4231 domain-containing protein [Thiothrix sp.]|uniref:DUF4231 domain-containing protein n=1 Tax=Thiothrix sp. TaxID=1032 RepID=UPI00260FF5E1|nr:DUF4231 domain-containing protein [Thiothrix sp.]MDD5393588.1 DUF4231 domain-containing protein [Thiothrix sp.]